MNLRKTALAVAVAGTFALGAAGPAQAYVMSGSMLNMTNFQILGSDGNILDYNTDFFNANGVPTLTFTGTADQSVALDGFAPLSNSATNPPTNPIDFAPICLGAGCVGFGLTNNSLPKPLAPPATGNYSAADQYEDGAPLANIPDFDPAGGANVGNATYVGLDTGTVEGSATANNNLNSSFVFALGNNQDAGITFAFDLDAFLQVAVSSDELFPGFATASLDMNFTITNLNAGGAEVFNWTPDIFSGQGRTLSLNAPLPFDIEIVRDTGGPIAFSNTTAALVAGNLYQVSFRMTTEADAGRVAAVPEPTALSLLGIGLLGLGASRRMLRKTAA